MDETERELTARAAIVEAVEELLGQAAMARSGPPGRFAFRILVMCLGVEPAMALWTSYGFYELTSAQ